MISITIDVDKLIEADIDLGGVIPSPVISSISKIQRVYIDNDGDLCIIFPSFVSYIFTGECHDELLTNEGAGGIPTYADVVIKNLDELVDKLEEYHLIREVL